MIYYTYRFQLVSTCFTQDLFAIHLPIQSPSFDPIPGLFQMFASRKRPMSLLGCSRKLGSMVRISGLFHPNEFPIYNLGLQLKFTNHLWKLPVSILQYWRSASDNCCTMPLGDTGKVEQVSGPAWVGLGWIMDPGRLGSGPPFLGQ